jgi:hypothetical protein
MTIGLGEIVADGVAVAGFAMGVPLGEAVATMRVEVAVA